MRHRPPRVATACTAVLLLLAALVTGLRPDAPSKSIAKAAAGVTRSLPASAAAFEDASVAPSRTGGTTVPDPCDKAERAPLDPDERETAVDRYRATLLQRLIATGDPLDRAVAALVADRSEANRAAWLAEVDALARSAVLSADSRLYGLAWHACLRLKEATGAGTAEACAQLSPAQWLRIDPDNGRLWLDAAAQARQHHDTRSEADALFHASTAGDYLQPTDVAPRRLLAAMRAQDPAWLRYPVLHGLTRALGLSSRWGQLHEASRLSGSCADEALDDANRRELCTRLANRLLDGSVSSEAVLPGLMIATELKWPPERTGGRQQDAGAIFVAEGLLPEDPVDCGDARDGVALLEATLGPDAAKRLKAEQPRRIVAALEERRRSKEAQEEEEAKKRAEAEPSGPSRTAGSPEAAASAASGDE